MSEKAIVHPFQACWEVSKPESELVEYATKELVPGRVASICFFLEVCLLIPKLAGTGMGKLSSWTVKMPGGWFGY